MVIIQLNNILSHYTHVLVVPCVIDRHSLIETNKTFERPFSIGYYGLVLLFATYAQSHISANVSSMKKYNERYFFPKKKQTCRRSRQLERVEISGKIVCYDQNNLVDPFRMSRLRIFKSDLDCMMTISAVEDESFLRVQRERIATFSSIQRSIPGQK